MATPIAGRVALVTGASGSIGRAVAAALVQRGAHVFVTTRAASHESHRHLHTLIPNLAGSITSPLADDAACDAVVKRIVGAKSHAAPQPHEHAALFSESAAIPAQRIDIVVHCAGATMNKLAARTTPDDFNSMFFVNAVCPVTLALSVLRHGKIQQQNRHAPAAATAHKGVMVALGSVAGEDGNAGQIAYAASKGALTSAWRSLAREYESRGVRFNVVAPGLVESRMAEALGEEHRRAWVARCPAGRLIRPGEVADAVMRCCVDEAMNGAVVRVDGH